MYGCGSSAKESTSRPKRSESIQYKNEGAEWPRRALATAVAECTLYSA
jgi:hypothetical protein